MRLDECASVCLCVCVASPSFISVVVSYAAAVVAAAPPAAPATPAADAAPAAPVPVEMVYNAAAAVNPTAMAPTVATPTADDVNPLVGLLLAGEVAVLSSVVQM